MARELSRVGEAARPLAAHPGAETPDRAQAPSFSACLEAFRAECRTARPIHLALLREIGDGFRCLVHTARSCAGAHLVESNSRGDYLDLGNRCHAWPQLAAGSADDPRLDRLGEPPRCARLSQGGVQDGILDWRPIGRPRARAEEMALSSLAADAHLCSRFGQSGYHCL